MSESLERPLVLTANVEDPELVRSFVGKYRLSGPQVPANMPTACALVRSTRIDLVEVKDLVGDKEVFIYWDDRSKLRKDFIEEVLAFWNSRKPWEDYDFCVFPKSLEWCVAFTHNDSSFVSISSESHQTK